MSQLDSLLNLVKTYEEKQVYDSALVLAFEGIKQSQLENNVGFEIKFRIRSGTILSDVDKNEEALSYYYTAHNLAEQIADDAEMGRSLLGIGVIFHIETEFDSAINYYNRSLAYLSKAGDDYNYHGTLANMAMLYDALGNKQKAEEMFLKSVKYRVSNNDYKGLAGSYFNISRMYLSEGDYQKAKEYAFKSLSIAKRYNF